MAVYQALFAAWGPQRWWPAKTRFEMMVGAILTQNTAWTNVEKAIVNLKRAKALSPRALHAMTEVTLAELIRPAGYFNVKARRLKRFVAWLQREHGGQPAAFFRGEAADLRRRLLAVHGIGKETADSMLLYAGYFPVFVVDAYTRSFLLRHNWIDPKAGYDDIAAMFREGLNTVPVDRKVAVFNEYHALIVALAKKHCRSKPECASCPLRRWLP
jgi:endonuclease-3 related protein